MTMSVAAAIQMTSGPDVAANLAAARGLLERARARGAVLAALPENFAFMGRKEADKRAVAEADGEGPIQEFLGALRARARPVDRRRHDADSRCSGAGRVARPAWCSTRAAARGALRQDPPVRRGRPGRRRALSRVRDASRPARSRSCVDTPLGRLGLAVCYDMRFPELFRELSAEGAEIFSVPSAFTAPTGRAHWETLLRARAIENLCYVIAPAQSGLPRERPRDLRRRMIVDTGAACSRAAARHRACSRARSTCTRSTSCAARLPCARRTACSK